MTTEKNEITEDLSKVDFTKFIDDYDEWICTVCQEGDSAFDGARIFHTCGNHEYHSECLAGVRTRGDIRCSVCRFPPNATLPPTHDDTIIVPETQETTAPPTQYSQSTVAVVPDSKAQLSPKSGR